MKKFFVYAGALAFSALTMQSCLDFDNPGDELGLGNIKLDNTTVVSKTGVDSIDYRFQLDDVDQLNNITTTLKIVGGQAMPIQFILRGGKNAELPGPHAYQYQFTNCGPDLYAQYLVVPHHDFEFGSPLTSTYDLSDYRGSATSAYTMAKNAIMPLLHHASIDSVPEIKAIGLLLFSLAAQEAVDMTGALTYIEDKQNLEKPRTYNDMKSVYYGIVDNLDTIVACLKNFENRPDWYQKQMTSRKGMVKSVFGKSKISSSANEIDVFIRMANSLKLRMAMNIVKVEPETAQKWAEEAVASGVIENETQQCGLSEMIAGVTHPLYQIATEDWQDAKLCASLESILKSYNHPYLKYLFKKNDGEITNRNTGDVTAKDTDIFGIRAGAMVEKGKQGGMNNYIYYSMLNKEVIKHCPLYYIKYSEVCFLRAEGAIRGWNMGGNAEQFYNDGIRYGCAQAPGEFAPEFTEAIDEYMNLETPYEFTQVDPIGDGDAWPSVTKVGVKWNDGDNNETKLEKIITQKYIALFPLSTVAWTDLRRTGFPKMFPVLNPQDGDGSLKEGDIIRRIPWVPNDPEYTEMVNETGLKALGEGAQDTQAQRLWWDVDVPAI